MALCPSSMARFGAYSLALFCVPPPGFSAYSLALFCVPPPGFSAYSLALFCVPPPGFSAYSLALFCVPPPGFSAYSLALFCVPPPGFSAYSLALFCVPPPGFGAIGVSVEGPHRSNLQYKEKSATEYVIQYKPHEPGIYLINVRFADDHVPGKTEAKVTSSQNKIHCVKQ